MEGLTRYLAGLRASWEALCGPARGGQVVTTDAYLAAVSPHAFLNNGVLLSTAALPELCDLYRENESFAVWTPAGDSAAEAAMHDAGFARDVTTRPMLGDRASLPRNAGRGDVESDVEPARVAWLNGVPAEVLEDVAGLRCFVTSGDDCGLVLQDAGQDVVMSFVATRPAARGRGLATRLVAAALSDATERGAAAVVLQATPQAEGIYRRLGFRTVGAWQEWTPPPRLTGAQRVRGTRA